MTFKLDIKDWARGTTPPITINAQRNGAAFSLVGCTIAMTVRPEKWKEGTTDDDALLRRHASFYQVPNIASLPALIVSPSINDIAWIDDTASAMRFNGSNWGEAVTNENRILEGRYTIRFGRAETMLPVGKYFHSIDIKFPNGEVAKICKGQFNITDNTVNEI